MHLHFKKGNDVRIKWSNYSFRVYISLTLAFLAAFICAENGKVNDQYSEITNG